MWPTTRDGAPMYICICRVVSSTTVRAVIAEGARTVRQVADACGAGTDCGRCTAHVRALLEEQHGPRARGRLEPRP
jgi:bacterioferritin-associated ferredoxin